MIDPRVKLLRVAYRRVFESPEGQRVLADLKKHCPLLTSSINVSKGIDPLVLSYREGQRSIVLYVYNMLKRDPNEDRPERAKESSNG